MSRLLLAACLAGGIGISAAGWQAPGRQIVVVGDLHAGPVREASGAWPASEDFRWGAEFAAFLDAIDKQGGGATDLILNGDTFELTRPVARECEADDPAVGCSEADALVRLDRVLAAHGELIARLSAFARAGANRVVLVPGDHDAAMIFPAVGARLLAALGAPAARIEVAASGGWLSEDGRVYAEHGHQIGANPHRFETWPEPFVDRAGRRHLVRPWGEQLMQRIYAEYEPTFPVVDNIAANGVGVKWAMAAAEVEDVAADAPALLKYFLSTVVWLQFRLDLDGGETSPPEWDLARVRSAGAAALVAGLPGDDRFAPLAAKALADGRFAALLDEFSDDQLRAVCDYRAAVRRARRRMERVLTQLPGQGTPVVECARTPETRGSQFEFLWTSRDKMFTSRLAEVRTRLKLPERSIDVYVHGHTHLPDRSQATFNMINAANILAPEGFTPVRGSRTPIAINGGAWQRIVTPTQLEEARMETGLSDADLMKGLSVEQLAPCYSFVLIPAYGVEPEPAVRFWRQAAGGPGVLAENCGAQLAPPAGHAPARP